MPRPVTVPVTITFYPWDAYYRVDIGNVRLDHYKRKADAIRGVYRYLAHYCYPAVPSFTFLRCSKGMGV